MLFCMARCERLVWGLSITSSLAYSDHSMILPGLFLRGLLQLIGGHAPAIWPVGRQLPKLCLRSQMLPANLHKPVALALSRSLPSFSIGSQVEEGSV